VGTFDLDDVLRDLSEPDPAAPREAGGVAPGAPGAPSAPGVPGVTGVPGSAGAPGASGVAGTRGTTRGPGPMFVRTDPREVPRPPDVMGSGLGTELDTQIAAGKADPSRVRPADALAEIPAGQDAAAAERTDDIGKVLLQRGLIKHEQFATAQRVIKQTPGRRMAQVLIEMGVDEADVQGVIAEQAGLPFETIDPDSPRSYDLKLLHRLTPDFCKASLVMPLRREGARLVVGTASPDDVFLLDGIKRRLGVPSIKHVLVTAADIRAVIDTLSEAETEEVDVEKILSDVEDDDIEIVKDQVDQNELEEAESSPVVRYVNHIIQTALKEGASDIHIEPDDKALKVRFRIDGVLFEMMNPPKKMHSAITSRIKIMANLDIAERRLPQDGRIRITVLGRKLDLRVSTVPTPKGEKTVMRILDNRSINVSLDDLGFSENTLALWKKQIDQPHGIILVTGPTGSGKTTTLYASIRQMDIRKMNVSTVEDPVEYNLAGITQIQTHEKIGMTFAAALRSLLRQDPDVVMLGEVRDLETATIAIQAALTGHLVLSTLHTNDAPSSVTRLINIGIEPFLVAAACNAILAQRLARRICEHCKHALPVSDEAAELLAMHGVSASQLMHGKGCPRCRETGYSGRVGLYELLLLDDFLRDKIASNPNVTEFRRICCERGMMTLRQDGFDKVAKGFTTVEEILRVTQTTI
jgi:type IV pilus assembly protein PilB